MGSLAGKVALVTGGGQGLGYDIAHALADEGMNLVLTGRVQEKLEAKAAILGNEGVEVLAIEGDVGQRSTAEATLARTLERFGRLDVLVNNAQTLSLPVPLIEQDDALIDAIIGSGLYGTIYFMQAAYPALAKEGGAVINLGSGQGLVGGWGTASYAAAKEGIRALSKVAAREWGKDGIRVNTICPGAWSPSMDEWFKDKPEELEAMLSQAPLGRFADGYRDVGRLAVFLAGPDCFMTGQTFYIDGGQLMPCLKDLRCLTTGPHLPPSFRRAVRASPGTWSRPDPTRPSSIASCPPQCASPTMASLHLGVSSWWRPSSAMPLPGCSTAPIARRGRSPASRNWPRSRSSPGRRPRWSWSSPRPTRRARSRCGSRSFRPGPPA
jgi:NAD(P)-dependent dehydrogenase (short-subunit alcohol dehydrogenase family)